MHCTLTSRASESVPVILTGSQTFQPSGSASGPRMAPPSAYARARKADGGSATVRGMNAKFVDNLPLCGRCAQSPVSQSIEKVVAKREKKKEVKDLGRRTACSPAAYRVAQSRTVCNRCIRDLRAPRMWAGAESSLVPLWGRAKH